MKKHFESAQRDIYSDKCFLALSDRTESFYIVNLQFIKHIFLILRSVGHHQEERKPVQIIKKGDVIKIGKNVKHWHGGTADQAMTHIAISIDHEKNP